MNTRLNSPRLWMAPWLFMLLMDAAMGWLDPAYWLGDGLPPSAPTQSTASKEGSNPRHSAARAAPTAPAPWPDEPALRRRLLWHGLTPLGLTLGPQRGRQTEVRLWLRWHGGMGSGLNMLESLAMDWPQMALETLTLQAESAGLWRFEWRGLWRQVQAPNPGPPAAQRYSEWQALGSARVFNPGWLQSHLRRLYAPGANPQSWLRLARPEQLQLLAVAHDPRAQAWVAWQNHILLLREGERIGMEQVRVKRIQSGEVELQGPVGTLRLRPKLSGAWPSEDPP